MLERFSRKIERLLFRTRSADRDAQTDHARVGAMWRVLQQSLQATRAEQAGLLKRLESVVAGALVSLGNGTDEYLTRDARDNRRLGEYEDEIRGAERRLKQLSQMIAQFEELKTTLRAKFPDFSNENP